MSKRKYEVTIKYIEDNELWESLSSESQEEREERAERKRRKEPEEQDQEENQENSQDIVLGYNEYEMPFIDERYGRSAETMTRHIANSEQEAIEKAVKSYWGKNATFEPSANDLNGVNGEVVLSRSDYIKVHCSVIPVDSVATYDDFIQMYDKVKKPRQKRMLQVARQHQHERKLAIRIKRNEIS
jgi:hypothetical protein